MCDTFLSLAADQLIRFKRSNPPPLLSEHVCLMRKLPCQFRVQGRILKFLPQLNHCKPTNKATLSLLCFKRFQIFKANSLTEKKKRRAGLPMGCLALTDARQLLHTGHAVQNLAPVRGVQGLPRKEAPWLAKNGKEVQAFRLRFGAQGVCELFGYFGRECCTFWGGNDFALPPKRPNFEGPRRARRQESHAQECAFSLS